MQNSVIISPSGVFTVRGRGNSDLGYWMDNGGFQVLFQNGSVVNPASHAVGTVDSFPEFNPLNAELNPICHLLALLGGAAIVVVSRLRVKAAEAREQNTTHSAEVENECYCTASAEVEMNVTVTLLLRDGFT